MTILSESAIMIDRIREGRNGMTRYGVVRNGEHLSLHLTEQDAKNRLDEEKTLDARLVAKGWPITPGQYHIEHVTGRVW